jgi:hypothetical protein
MAHSNPISRSRSVYFFHIMGTEMKTIQSQSAGKRLEYFHLKRGSAMNPDVSA